MCDDSQDWADAGRRLARRETAHRRGEMSDVLYHLEWALDKDGCVTAEEVREVREQLNILQEFLEEFVAPAVEDVEPWGEPYPRRPYGKYPEPGEDGGESE